MCCCSELILLFGYVMLWLDFLLKYEVKLSIGDELILVQRGQSCSYEMKRCGHFMDISTVNIYIYMQCQLVIEHFGWKGAEYSGSGGVAGVVVGVAE